MSLTQPSVEVKYIDRTSVQSLEANWTDVSSDVLGFNIIFREVKSGLNQWNLDLDNKAGKYDSIFPRYPSEKGLGYYFRFKVNNVVLMNGVVEEITCRIDSKGDVISFRGYGKDYVLGNLLFNGKIDGSTQIDDAIDALLTDAYHGGGYAGTELSDNISFTVLGYTDTIKTDFEAEDKSLLDCLRDLLSLTEYEAVVESGVAYGAATLRLFKRDDPSYRYSTTQLISKLNDASSNCLKVESMRDISEVYNWINFAGGDLTPGIIPETGKDKWSDSLRGWSAVDPAVTEISLDSVNKVSGSNSIHGKHKGIYPFTGTVEIELDLTNTSVYQRSLDTDEQGIGNIHFFYAHIPGKESSQRVFVRITLIDSAGKTARYDLPVVKNEYKLGVFVSPVFAGQSFPCNKENERFWTTVGAVDSGFNWILSKIRFSLIAAAGAVPLRTPEIWIDELYFDACKGSLWLREDAGVGSSQEKYGKRMMRYTNKLREKGLADLKDDILNQRKNPVSMMKVSALINPADENSVLYPGYGIQCDMPRIGIDTPANGGVWWRILETKYRFTRQGFVTELKLTPASSETIDYSKFDWQRGLEYDVPFAVLKEVKW